MCVCLKHSTLAIKVGCAACNLVDNLRCLTHHVDELTLILRYVMSNPLAVEDRSNMSLVVARDQGLMASDTCIAPNPSPPGPMHFATSQGALEPGLERPQ